MNFSSVLLGDASSAADELAALNISSRAVGTLTAVPRRYGFLDVLDVLRQYQVPSNDLTSSVGTTEAEAQEASAATSSLERAADRATRAFSHTLGGGYSAAVMKHATKEDIFSVTTDRDILEQRTPKLVAKSGTLVAFKKISPRPSDQSTSDNVRKSEAFRTICQEILVCRHPLLLSHENISKLLYVTWQRSDPFPWIALELAAFGTLEDILTAAGEGPTYKQKWNLTIDIARGVAALHHIDIVHGDLKPANILVHRHPNRQIVGQVADFGGSAAIGEGIPSIGTPLWCAPEVVLATTNVNWKLADTWSYGLIVASIWSHVPDSERSKSSCFLEKLVSQDLEGDHRDTRIFLIKTEPDCSADSLISSCSILPHCITPLVSGALSFDSSQRNLIETLLTEHIAPICSELNRESSDNYSHGPVPQRLPFKVWANGYRTREFRYHQTVFEHLVESAKPLRESIECQSKVTERSTKHSDARTTPELASIDSLDSAISDACNAAISYQYRFDRQAIIAFQVAVSHCLQLGVQLDEKELLSWVYVAAKGGHSQAPWIAPLLDASCENTYGDHKYRMICLAIGACLGSMPSLVALKAANRTLYESTRAIIRSKSRPNFQHDHVFDVFEDFLGGPSLDLANCSLVEALKSHNVDHARAILEQNTLDVSDTCDEHGHSVLHAITYLPDEETEGLALLASVHGADLSFVATLSELTVTMLYRNEIKGTPIYWAATKGMLRLFGDLLQLHVDTGTVIKDALPMMVRAASLHHHELLSLMLHQRKNTPELFAETDLFGSDQLLSQALLGAVLTSADYVPVSRRLIHGPETRNAQTRTLNLIISEGAVVTEPCFGFEDFTDISGGHTAISLAIANDDDVALALLLQQPRVSPHQTAILDTLDGTLQMCVVRNALRCFNVTLDIFPELINFSPMTEGRAPTLTPLNMAARISQPGFALALLERGADTSIRHENFSTLTRALVDGYTETAEVIYNFCSDAERQQDFGYDPATGFTLMGRIMSVWVTRLKSQAQIESVKWLDAKGGARFECNNIDHAPVWAMILCRRASSSVDQEHLDNSMLETLFALFPEMLDVPDSEGIFPLHRATMNGHRKAIEYLLDKGVNIDAESLGPRIPQGITSFTIAVQRLQSNPPYDIIMGGRVEVRRWRERMKDILQLLLSRGATIGQHPRMTDMLRSLQYTAPNVSYTTNHARDQDDELEWGKDIWPQRLPSDETSSRENQRNGGELIEPQMKNVLRTLLPRSFVQRENQMTDEEMGDYAQYCRWLTQKAKMRREQYYKPDGNAPVAEADDTSLLPPSWQRWHANLSMPRHKESRDLKGKGKMRATE